MLPNPCSQPFAQIDGLSCSLNAALHMLKKLKVIPLERQAMLPSIHGQHFFAEIIQLDDFKLSCPSVYKSLGSILLTESIAPG
jgi:hypothetical protein